MDVVAPVLLCTLSILLFFVVILTVFSFYYTFGRRKKEINLYYLLDGDDPKGIKACSKRLIDEFIKIEPTRDVYIQSHDGLSLHARYYESSKGAPIQIQCHGYRSISFRDFSGGGADCLQRGHNLLLIDQRAHGKSEGRVISFGILERYDVLEWARWAAKEYPSSPILIYGISMGAASALMASELDLPENVRLIVADSPYSSPKEIITKVAGDMRLPGRLAYPLVKLSARIFGGFDLDASSPVSAVKNARVPILIVHGEGDGFVPCEMSRDIAAASDKIRLELFPDATHGLSYIYDTERYKKIIDEFLNEHI